jgi:hypothetical protein
MKIFKSIIIVFVAIAATSNFATAQTSNTFPKVEEVTTMLVKVKGVGCDADIKSISGNVEKVGGVSRCKTVKKGATTTFEVTLVESIAKEEEIYAAIEGTPGCTDPNARPYKVKKK